MFFIMGISQKEKKLNFDQLIICECCGKYGHLEIYMTYSCFMFFFIPIFKWNKRYYARMNCCHSTCELNVGIGKEIEVGRLDSLDIDVLNFGDAKNDMKCCSNCGFTTTEDFHFCTKCGGTI